MTRLIPGVLVAFLTAGCLTLPPHASTNKGDRDRVEAAVAEKLPLVTPVPVTADNCESQMQALQREMDAQMKKLASTRPADSDQP